VRHLLASFGGAFIAISTVGCGGAFVEPTPEMRFGETQKFVATADVTLHERSMTSRQEADCYARGSTDETGGFACLMRFSLPEARVSIRSAWLELHALNRSPLTFDIYPVLVNWSEDATWKHRAPGLPWQTAGAKGAADRGPKLGELTVPVRGDVTYIFDEKGRALLESWLEDPSTNRGIVIASESNWNGIGFTSRENPNADDRPTLVIQAGGSEAPR
jgi:hypothetical protein